MLAACIIAFAMYSRIPMLRVDWSRENMRYVLCFFPLVGAAVGGIYYLAACFLVSPEVSKIAAAAVLTVIPILVTGGIHMDGFLDTIDARRSYAPKEKKLEILKDPNSGAFAVIYACVWFLLYYAAQAQLLEAGCGRMRLFGAVAAGFVYSRALSGFAAVSFKGAKKSGLLASFSDGAQKRTVRIVTAGFVVAAAAAMTALQPFAGAAAAAAGLVVFFYYRWMAYREFDGITGDLAGYFVQVCELAIGITAVIAGRTAGI